jgi:hypothetical protein
MASPAIAAVLPCGPIVAGADRSARPRMFRLRRINSRISPARADVSSRAAIAGGRGSKRSISATSAASAERTGAPLIVSRHRRP